MAVEIAVRHVMDLLVRGEFDTVVSLTRGRRLRSRDIAGAITTYGRTLAAPDGDWWAAVDVVRVLGSRPVSYVVDAPFCTVQERRSDLTLQLRLTETAPAVFDIEVMDIRVL